MIPKLLVNDEVLINIPADKNVLLELGLSESEANKIISDHWLEIELNKIRFHRESLLAEADRLVNAALDQQIDITPYRVYRQKLRNITNEYHFLSDVVWPEKPELPV
ncbi:phage tail assembly chaperone [Photorhabdus cinerea]|uniref:Phage tail assembly chaperone-like domain-containing protein n=1 Tax=Photorhabdus cinerea TaxID=471575 RepID=A0A7X5TI60_9GAMM|nr:phage tail assembly chaperone [Photorhabdus cinerea]NHB94561.1 hypothetical protein [Photorhabdus cinerea]